MAGKCATNRMRQTYYDQIFAQATAVVVSDDEVHDPNAVYSEGLYNRYITETNFDRGQLPPSKRIKLVNTPETRTHLRSSNSTWITYLDHPPRATNYNTILTIIETARNDGRNVSFQDVVRYWYSIGSNDENENPFKLRHPNNANIGELLIEIYGPML
ncbi:MAG: hypothetical protein AAF990_21610 [Bacteroidota bacterium]